MVKPFQVSRLPEIVFGQGKISYLPQFVKRYGTSLMVITRDDSFTDSEQWGELLSAFRDNNLRYRLFTVSGEPTPDVVDGAVKEAKEFSPELIAAIGGGSVIDTGKAVSAMITVDDPVVNYLEGIGTLQHPGSKLPFIAVPTTSGTGSEATKNAVISSIGPGGFKKSLRHDNFVPDVAVIDPELTISCPPYLTAASGMDCFSQLTEAFLSEKASDFTDALAFRGIKAVSESLVRAFKEGNDIEARCGMSFAALCSGICLANAGLGTVHGFASSVGALFDIPHGVICGTLMAPANEISLRELKKDRGGEAAINKYRILGSLFAGQEQMHQDSADYFISVLYNLSSALDLPKLGKFGVGEADIERILQQTDNKNNPVKLNSHQLAEIVLKML
jgi:alcohol dehydrogenase class IV